MTQTARRCRGCGGAISEARLRRRAVFCTRDCQQEDWRRRYGKQRESLADGLHTSAIGAIAEAAVATDLMSRGIEVYRAMNPAAPFDMVGVVGDHMLRVEVRTGHRRQDDSGELQLIRFPKDRGRSDMYAVVVHSSPREIVYMDPDCVPIGDVAGLFGV